MNPQQAIEKQMEAYRRMSGEQRLQIGLGLYDSALDVAREAIRRQFPDADEAAIETRLHARIKAGYAIENSGTPCS